MLGEPRVKPAILFFDLSPDLVNGVVVRIAEAGWLPIVNSGPVADALLCAGVQHRTWDQFVPTRLASHRFTGPSLSAKLLKTTGRRGTAAPSA